MRLERFLFLFIQDITTFSSFLLPFGKCIRSEKNGIFFLFLQNITNEGLRLACRLPSLTCLNASRCHGITVEGLAGLGQAANRLKRLNLGWCRGLAGRRVDSGSGSDREDQDEGEEEAEEDAFDGELDEESGDDHGDEEAGEGDDENDDDFGNEDEYDEDDEDDVHDGNGVQHENDGQQVAGVFQEGNPGIGDRVVGDTRRRRRRTRRRSRRRGMRWALPRLPKLERLCLAR